MKIFLVGDMAFIETNAEKQYMLCIGSKAEVDEADGPKLQKMIQEAMAMSDYHKLDDTRGVKKH